MDRLQSLKAYFSRNPDDPDLWIYEMLVKFEKERDQRIEAYRELHPEHKNSTLHIVLDENCNSIITTADSPEYNAMWDTGK